jgi:hypothetical protein
MNGYPKVFNIEADPQDEVLKSDRMVIRGGPRFLVAHPLADPT